MAFLHLFQKAVVRGIGGGGHQYLVLKARCLSRLTTVQREMTTAITKHSNPINLSSRPQKLYTKTIKPFATCRGLFVASVDAVKWYSIALGKQTVPISRLKPLSYKIQHIIQH